MRDAQLTLAAWIVLQFAAGTSLAADNDQVRSHPPMRPLPAASSRPLEKGPTFFVDGVKGNDRHDGSESKPWKTAQHAIGQLKPGDTLCLRGGTYYEHVTVAVSGTANKPITIRSYPGELAILDGGLREFHETPEAVWEPCPTGVDGEYWSVKAYPGLGAGPDGANVRGYFADSMTPFHGYRYANDLRDASMAWDLTDKAGKTEGVYCGPGVFYDAEAGRFHARLAHTSIAALDQDNYRGPTDPRKLPLVLATVNSGAVLMVQEAHDLRFQDLVVRGSATNTVEVSGAARVVFDGLTVYGGHTAFQVRGTSGLRMLHTACRGQAAPWTYRGHLKYRSTESRLFSTGGWTPEPHENSDFELAYCEFTDSVDGVFLGNVRGVQFHHNLLDNVSDDGLYLTATTAYDGTTPGGDVHVYQNVLSRCLTTFAFGVGHGRQKAVAGGRQTGAGLYIYRNVLDFRRPVPYQIPIAGAASPEPVTHGRFASDHGSPVWEPMNVYHNTIVANDPGGYAYATWGLGSSITEGTSRRVFNNVVVQTQGLPGKHYPPTTADLQVDGNLLWSVEQGSTVEGEFFAAFRQSKEFAESQSQYPPGWSASDRFADPQFVRFAADWRAPLDLSLQANSPAIDAGLPIPSQWPDPIVAADLGQPDIGVLPLGAVSWRVGVAGRLSMFGEPATSAKPPQWTLRPFADAGDVADPPKDQKPAAIVQGYPAFDLPLIEFALGKRRMPTVTLERTWLEPRDYFKYRLVAITGDLARAGIKPRQYSPADLPLLKRYLETGGVLLLTRGAAEVFSTSEGRPALAGLIGAGRAEPEPKLEVLQPKHPWIEHVDFDLYRASLNVPDDPLNDTAPDDPSSDKPAPNEPTKDLLDELDAPTKTTGESTAIQKGMLDARKTVPLNASKGERIIGTRGGLATLYRLRVGKGQLIYLGWEIADALPAGRKPSTVEQERMFEDQMQILTKIVADIDAPGASAP